MTKPTPDVTMLSIRQLVETLHSGKELASEIVLRAIGAHYDRKKLYQLVEAATIKAQATLYCCKIIQEALLIGEETTDD